ncbi:Imm50 family immunity protein [Kitasatospora indigofera]|uniref:Imm50 family immunity protein n=1 Tax=Kitasatospora indigofera TaxID=67307 RepID=UPI00365E7739
MRGSDRAQVPAAPDDLAALLGGLHGGLLGGLPAFEDLDLFHLLADERGDSVTLGFEHAGLPPAPPPDWLDKGLNTVEFFLVLSGLTRLEIDGWSYRGLAEYTLSRTRPGHALLSMRGPGSTVEIEFAAARVEGLRAFRAAPQ